MQRKYNLLAASKKYCKNTDFKKEVLKLNTNNQRNGSTPATTSKQSVGTYMCFLTNAIHLAIS